MPRRKGGVSSSGVETFFSLLVALQLGAGPDGPTAALSVRAAARDAASELLLGPAELLRTPAVWEVAHAPEYPGAARGPASGPYFPAYRQEEWLTLFARNLRIEDTPFTRLVVKVLSFPVRLDLSASHAHVTLRFATF